MSESERLDQTSAVGLGDLTTIVPADPGALRACSSAWFLSEGRKRECSRMTFAFAFVLLN